MFGCGISVNVFVAWKIHISPQTKEILDVFGTFCMEHRGKVAMKVSIYVVYLEKWNKMFQIIQFGSPPISFVGDCAEHYAAHLKATRVNISTAVGHLLRNG